MSPMPDVADNEIWLHGGHRNCPEGRIGHRTHRTHQRKRAPAGPPGNPMGPMGGSSVRPVIEADRLASRTVAVGIGLIGLLVLDKSTVAATRAVLNCHR